MKQNLKKGLAALSLGAAALLPQMSNAQKPAGKPKAATAKPAAGAKEFKVEAEGFADLQTLRYQVPGFSELSLQQKKLAYYLYEAALSGRDIIYDQKSKNGLLLRKTLEAMYGTYKGERNGKRMGGLSDLLRPLLVFQRQPPSLWQ